MKAAIRYFHSPDVDDLERYEPENPSCFGVFVQVMIGPEGQPGEESFDFTVGTPGWLERELRGGGSKYYQHLLVLHEFDWNAVVRAVEAQVRAVSAPTWSELGMALNEKVGRWEFSNYRE